MHGIMLMLLIYLNLLIVLGPGSPEGRSCRFLATWEGTLGLKIPTSLPMIATAFSDRADSWRRRAISSAHRARDISSSPAKRPRTRPSSSCRR